MKWESSVTSAVLLSATLGNKTMQAREALRLSVSNGCEFVVFIQMHPLVRAFLGEQFKGQADAVERESKCPDGASSVLGSPVLKMSTLIFSPDCGFILQSMGPPKFLPTARTRWVFKWFKEL